MRNVLVTTKRLIKNSTITKADLTTKVIDGEGISAEDLYKVIWKKVVRDLPSEYVLTKDDIT